MSNLDRFFLDHANDCGIVALNAREDWADKPLKRLASGGTWMQPGCASPWDDAALSGGFAFTAHPARVVFGRGTLQQVTEEVARLGCRRVLVLSTPQQHEIGQAVCNGLGDRAAGSFADATMHTPVDVTVRALAQSNTVGADGFLAVGGGSTIGLGKALALRTGLPLLAVPTTYAGSEMTPILGETEGGRKTTQRTPAVLPRTVIYDVDLTVGLPTGLSVTSGINAIAHAVEALYAQDRNPVTSLLAIEGIRALGAALPAIAAETGNQQARAQALYGAWLCGICLGTSGMALHHKLCHVLGGSFDLPHAETHAAVLPHAVAYNASAAPDAMRGIAAALGTADAAAGLYNLTGRLGAPQSLAALGMPESGIDQAADQAVEAPYWNPRPIKRNGIRALIARAWAGLPPLQEPVE
jgi:maleylacetate reductase